MQVTFWIEFDLIFAFFYMQVIKMLFWGELNSIFTLSSLLVTIVTCWIEFDLIFAFFYMQMITIVFWTLYPPSSACRLPPWHSVLSCQKNSKTSTVPFSLFFGQ